MTLLGADGVRSALADLPQWSGDESRITRTLDAPDFPTAIRIVDDVAEAAEAMNHHPDIDIRWRTLTFTLATHSEGGVTSRDTELAGRIDDIAARHA